MDPHLITALPLHPIFFKEAIVSEYDVWILLSLFIYIDEFNIGNWSSRVKKLTAW